MSLPANDTSDFIIRHEGLESASSKAPSSTAYTCQFCLVQAARYTCPNCKSAYCGLDCYKSQKHAACSEKFYKANVEEDKLAGEDFKAAQVKIAGILKKFQINDDSEWKYEMPAGVEEKLKELDESKASDSENDPEDPDDASEDWNEVERFVDGASIEDLWDVLTPEERDEFSKMVERDYIIDEDVD